MYEKEGGSPTAPRWVWGHLTQAGDVGAPATSQRLSECGDAREVGQQGGSKPLRWTCFPLGVWSGKGFCPSFALCSNWICFAQTQISICLEKSSMYLPCHPPCMDQCLQLHSSEQTAGKKNKINHFVHLMASLDRQ